MPCAVLTACLLRYGILGSAAWHCLMPWCPPCRCSPTAAQVVEEVRSQLLALRQPLMQRAQQQQQQQQQAAVQLPVQKRASPLLAPADTPPQLPQLPAGQEVSPFTDAAQQAVPLTSAQASPFAQPPATPDEE